MSIHNIIFAKINGKWQATFIVGQSISHRNLYWHEKIYLRYLKIRDFITSRPAGEKG